MKVLVTGASGFVGRATLARLAVEDGISTRAAVRRPRARGTAGGTDEIVVGEVDASTDWRTALQDVHVVVHLAAMVHVTGEGPPPALGEFRRVNTEGTLNLARQAAAAGARRLVFVSSIKVNGDQGSFKENDPPRPVGSYATSKHEAELGLGRVARDSAMEITIVRPPLVYGPGVRANFRALIKAVSSGVPLPLAGVKNLRSLVAVDNLADFLVACAAHPAAGNEIFFVSDGDDISTRDLVVRLGRAMGRSARLWYVPPSVLRVAAIMAGRRGLATRLLDTLRVDISKARSLLGWTPPLALDAGLALAADPRNTGEAHG